VPTYDYQCRSCGSVTEVIHSMLEEGPSVCERCGGELRRVLYPTGIIFKGSGFYRTDSREGRTSSVTPSAKPSGDSKGADAKTGTDAKKGGESKAGSEASAKPASGEGTKGSGASGT
jgi:putative FmdB family regulatory protein